jgi:hypothetical protein
MEKQEKYPFVGDVVYRHSQRFVHTQRPNRILGADQGLFVWDTMSRPFREMLAPMTQKNWAWWQLNDLCGAINLLEPA